MQSQEYANRSVQSCKTISNVFKERKRKNYYCHLHVKAHQFGIKVLFYTECTWKKLKTETRIISLIITSLLPGVCFVFSNSCFEASFTFSSVGIIIIYYALSVSYKQQRRTKLASIYE